MASEITQDTTQEEQETPFWKGWDSGWTRYQYGQPLPAECEQPPYLMSQYFSGMLEGYNDAKEAEPMVTAWEEGA